MPPACAPTATHAIPRWLASIGAWSARGERLTSGWSDRCHGRILAAALMKREPNPAPELSACRQLDARMNHVVPLELTDDERSQAEDDAVDRGKPLPEAWGPLVLTSDQGKAGRALIQGLRPTWSRRGENPRLIPPSRGRP